MAQIERLSLQARPVDARLLNSIDIIFDTVLCLSSFADCEGFIQPVISLISGSELNVSEKQRVTKFTILAGGQERD